MARLKNGEWKCVALVFNGDGGTLCVGDSVEYFTGKSVGVWIEPDSDEIVLRELREDGE